MPFGYRLDVLQHILRKGKLASWYCFATYFWLFQKTTSPRGRLFQDCLILQIWTFILNQCQYTAFGCSWFLKRKRFLLLATSRQSRLSMQGENNNSGLFYVPRMTCLPEQYPGLGSKEGRKEAYVPQFHNLCVHVQCQEKFPPLYPVTAVKQTPCWRFSFSMLTLLHA